MSKVRLSAQERRAQIIAAAREVYIEHGVNGARSRLIAERAGITEAYLYRHFHSKGEIYRLAVDAPLKEMLERLEGEIHDLAQREEVSRTEVLFHCHEILLECTVEIAPLLAAAMFSDPSQGRKFYLDFVLPSFRSVVEAIIPDISGWPIEAFAVDVFAESLLGTHLGVAFTALLDERQVEVANVARQITVMFAPSMLGEGAWPSRSKRRVIRPAPSIREPSAPLALVQSETAVNEDGSLPKRRRLPAAERREKIILAARDVFFRDSMSGARTKDVAEQAGVTEAFLYRYFDSKAAMYEAAVLDPVRKGLTDLTANIEFINADAESPIEFIGRVNEQCLRYFIEYGRLHSVALFAELASGRKFYFADVEPHLDRMGRLIPEHSGWSTRGIDPHVVQQCALGAQFIVGLDHAFRGDDIDVEELAEELTVLFTGGIKEKASLRR